MRCDLTHEHAGYTDKKIGDLTRLYVHDESRASAVEQWRARSTRARKKSFAVGFHTYNHLVKTDRKHGVGSERMGPCIQSVTVSRNGDDVRVDVAYRQVEAFRCLAADLAFVRDVLLAPFEIRHLLPHLRLHVANVTCHPRDFPILLCNVEDPLAEMMALKRADRRFHDRAVRWLASFVCEERAQSIANYDRGKRGQAAVLRMMATDDLEDLRDYCRRHLR